MPVHLGQVPCSIPTIATENKFLSKLSLEIKEMHRNDHVYMVVSGTVGTLRILGAQL